MRGSPLAASLCDVSTFILRSPVPWRENTLPRAIAERGATPAWRASQNDSARAVGTCRWKRLRAAREEGLHTDVRWRTLLRAAMERRRSGQERSDQQQRSHAAAIA